MSPQPPQRRPRPQAVSRAAEIAGQQVGKIVAAAQASAEQVAAAAQKEADAVKARARASAQAEVEAARRGAVQMGEEARQEAAARIAAAQAAADDVLAEAKTVSAGMRQLGQLLTVHAERILRDVQNSHRAISADLRAAGERAGSAEPRDHGAEKSAGDEPASRPRRQPRASGGDNPFEEL